MIGSPTLRALIGQIVRQLFPWYVYGGVHLYKVKSVSSGLVDLVTPPGVARPIELPDLPAVPIWTGPLEVDPVAGVECGVVFLNNDERRPVVIAFAPLRDPGGIPTGVRCARADATVIREGDTITVGAASGPVVLVLGQGLPVAVSRLKA